MNNYYEPMLDECSVEQVHLILNRVLAICYSNELQFYQIENDDNGVRNWISYQIIRIRGSMNYISGKERFQFVSQEYIYFYKIDKDDDSNQVMLENAMFNFMDCT